MSESLTEDSDQETESGPLRVVLASDPLWRVLLRYLCFAVLVLVPVFQLALSIPAAHDGVFAALAIAIVVLLVEQHPPRKSSRYNLRSGEVSVREGTLLFDDHSLARLAEVREAQRLPGGKALGWLGTKVEPQQGCSGTGVHLLLRGWRQRLVFRTPDDETALLLVQRLGLGPGQRLTTVDAGPFRPNAFWILLVLVAGWWTALQLFWSTKFLGSTVSEYPYLFGALAVPANAVFRQVFHRKLSVGADGLRIRLLGRTRFVSFSDIARITHGPRSLALILTSGQRVVLVNQGSDKRSDPVDRGDACGECAGPGLRGLFQAHH